MRLLPGQRKQQSYWFGVYTSNIYSVRNLLRRQLQRIRIVWDSSWLTHWSWKKLMSPWTWSQRNTSMLSLKDLPDTSLGLEPDHIFISKDNKIFWNRGVLGSIWKQKDTCLNSKKSSHASAVPNQAQNSQIPSPNSTEKARHQVSRSRCFRVSYFTMTQELNLCFPKQSRSAKQNHQHGPSDTDQCTSYLSLTF